MPKVNVTQEDIEKSLPQDSSHCMIADAVKRSVSQAKSVSVDLVSIRYTVKDRRYVFFTPLRAQEALLQFDRGEKPEPFSMVLAKPAQTLQAKDNRKRTDRKKTVREVPSEKTKAPIMDGGHPIPRGTLQEPPGPRAKQLEAKKTREQPAKKTQKTGGGPHGAKKDDRVRMGRIRRYGLKRMGRPQKKAA